MLRILDSGPDGIEGRHDHTKITTQIQNSHHWESREVWLNRHPTTGNKHKRPHQAW